MIAICTLCELKQMKSEARCTICGILTCNNTKAVEVPSVRTAFEKLQREAMYKGLLLEKSLNHTNKYTVNYQGQCVFTGNFDKVKVYVNTFVQ